MPTRKATAKNGKNGKNGQTPLETAMTNLIQTQALFNQQIAQTNQQIAQINADIRAINAETREIERANAERFARIEQLLLKHELMLQELPEAIRQKIGFQQK